MAAEGSMNNDSAASELARTSSPNLLDNNGTQVCHEHLFKCIDAETEHEIQGVDNRNGVPRCMQWEPLFSPRKKNASWRMK